jgi:hypothetical protein
MSDLDTGCQFKIRWHILRGPRKERKMRIEIKTKGRVTNPDIRALYILVYALDKSTPRMKIANLQYIADRLGYKLIKI